MLVDDRRANLVALLALLTAPQYELVTAESGEQALAEIAVRDFALILLDLRMPGMDGIETAKRIGERARERGRRAPIIMVTANDTDRALVLQAYANGVVDLLQKPLEPSVLRAKVDVFAELYQARASVKATSHLLHTQQKEAEERAQRFRLIIESVKDYAIFILDPKGVVSTWNPGAERIKGYRASEIIGRHFSAFYPPEVAASGKCDLELEIAAREGRFEEEGWRLRKDGSRFWASVTITALRDPASKVLIGFAKVTRDLTDRMLHEQELRALAAETARLAEKAQIQEFQERFIAVLGHDLRNPLSAIDMGASLLRQRAADMNDETAGRVLNRMKSSSRRMSRMIEQILDLTRSRLAGGLVISTATADLTAIIAAIVDELRGGHPGRAIEVRCPPSVVGEWDPDRLEQVFSNLIGNAVDYSPQDGTVDVAVRVDDRKVAVTVHNAGAPIPEEARAELFSPFRRGARDSRTMETAGLGLGLFISREIVIAHGGTIEFRSDSTEGTTFLVTLPRDRARSV